MDENTNQIKELSIVPLKPKGIPNSKRQKSETKVLLWPRLRTSELTLTSNNFSEHIHQSVQMNQGVAVASVALPHHPLCAPGVFSSRAFWLLGLPP